MTTATEIANLDDLDLALAGLDVETIIEAGEDASADGETIVEDVLETITDEIVEEIAAEGSTEVTAADGALADDLLRDLDIGLEIAEAYAESLPDSADPAGAKAKKASHKPDLSDPASKAKVVRAKKERKDGEARTPRDISSVAPEFFALTEPADDADLEAIRAATMALKPEQKKIAEKFDNLFTSISVGKAPSTYVMIAFKLLDEKKECTSTDIVAAYKAADLGEGTARSQSGQIMNLFATVGIAQRTNQQLKLRADSKIAERLRALAA